LLKLLPLQEVYHHGAATFYCGTEKHRTSEKGDERLKLLGQALEGRRMMGG